MTDTSFDPKRRLCPDGSCIGVIGADGRCPVCGRRASGKPDMALVSDSASATDDGDDDAHLAAPAGDAPAGTDGFDPNRRLCEDGSCVGVIGADGRCSVCGREAGA
jgi:hypothetical protein